jgi:hypothetical protein
MLKKLLRQPYKKLLAKLTEKTIEKHQPSVIAVMGDGQTAIAREIVYHLLKQKYPVRRNLESPEAEFNIPLTVLGYPKYPYTIFEWLEVLIKNYFNLKRIGPYRHFLVLELNFVDSKILDFWLKVLKPETALIVGNVPLDYSEYEIKKVVKITRHAGKDILGPYRIAVTQLGRFYNFTPEEVEKALESFSLPQSKIRFFPGKNGTTIIDATHYYFPIALSSVLELADAQEKTSRLILFSHLKADKNLVPKDALLNPKNYQPQENDIIIIRGRRDKKLVELEKLFTTRGPLF